MCSAACAAFNQAKQMMCSRRHILKQPVLGKVHSVKGENLKKFDCPSWSMVCSPCSNGLDLQKLNKCFVNRPKGGPQ